MRQFPPIIQQAVAVFTRLPGVGPKTALRYVYTMLKKHPADIQSFAKAVENLAKVQSCSECYTFSDRSPCEICASNDRLDHTLCVVAEPRDIAIIEATGEFKGKYHVLGGTINALEGLLPQDLQIDSLVNKLKQNPEISEIIMAISPDVHGESTTMYISNLLKDHDVRTTRLARGLPMGSDLEFADEITLSDAIKGRREI